MTYRPATVTQAEVTRAVKAVVAAGLSVARVEVDLRTGRVVVFPAGAAPETARNPWD